MDINIEINPNDFNVLMKQNCCHKLPLFRSPLRYPGGKGKLAKFFASICIKNNIRTYIEPYAGGCGIGVSLLQNNIVQNIVINDIDPIIHAFWHSALNDTDAFVAKIMDTPLTVSEWETQQYIVKHYEKYDIFSIGFAAFYMNRTNRSGIIHAGMIGGKSQAGKYKIDARFNKENLIERIYSIGKHNNAIKLFNLDAIELIKKQMPQIDEGCLIYFDPPYYYNANTLYKNFYKKDDHEKIACFIKQLRTPYIVTYDNVEQIKELYSDNACLPYDLSYSASNKKRKGQELFIYNNFEI